MNKKQLSGFFASLLALLAAWGIYRPSPGPSPTPSPTATATATPEPSSSPTPEPTALPTPSPTVDPCANFEATGAPYVDKPTIPSVFREAVEEAQDKARENGFVVGDYVIGEREYTQEVARILREAGYRATACGIPDEVWVEGPAGEYSDSFDLVIGGDEDDDSSAGLVWTHYAAKVTPSAWREKKK